MRDADIAIIAGHDEPVLYIFHSIFLILRAQDTPISQIADTHTEAGATRTSQTFLRVHRRQPALRVVRAPVAQLLSKVFTVRNRRRRRLCPALFHCLLHGVIWCFLISRLISTSDEFLLPLPAKRLVGQHASSANRPQYTTFLPPDESRLGYAIICRRCCARRRNATRSESRRNAIECRTSRERLRHTEARRRRATMCDMQCTLLHAC